MIFSASASSPVIWRPGKMPGLLNVGQDPSPHVYPRSAPDFETC